VQCSQRKTSRPGPVTDFATGIVTSVVAISFVRRARAGLPCGQSTNAPRQELLSSPGTI